MFPRRFCRGGVSGHGGALSWDLAASRADAGGVYRAMLGFGYQGKRAGEVPDHAAMGVASLHQLGGGHDVLAGGTSLPGIFNGDHYSAASLDFSGAGPDFARDDPAQNGGHHFSGTRQN